MIPDNIEIIAVVSVKFDGDEFRVRFRLSDGRVSETYWTHADLRQCGTPFDDDDVQPRHAPWMALQ